MNPTPGSHGEVRRRYSQSRANIDGGIELAQLLAHRRENTGCT